MTTTRRRRESITGSTDDGGRRQQQERSSFTEVFSIRGRLWSHRWFSIGIMSRRCAAASPSAPPNRYQEGTDGVNRRRYWRWNSRRFWTMQLWSFEIPDEHRQLAERGAEFAGRRLLLQQNCSYRGELLVAGEALVIPRTTKSRGSWDLQH